MIAHDAVAENKDETAWDSESVHALVTHIVDHHHRFLRTELPRLVDLLDRAVEDHRAEHPELEKIQETFLALEQELKAHMTKEEQVLFPIVQQLEEAQTTQQPLPQFHCGSVNNPIRSMEREHTDAAELLSELRRLTGGYRPSTDTCDAYRALLSGMKQLEADLHVHIHKENNILFLKASDLETALAVRA